MNIDNVEEWLGMVSGPGDQFTSSGPHGETSMQAQQKASQPAQDDESLLASVFGGGDDEELLTAESGAASDAAQAAINFGNQAEEDIIMDTPLPNPILSNPGVFDPPIAAPSSSTEPADVVQNQAETGSGLGLSKTQLLLLGAAAVGVVIAFGSKKRR